MNYKKKFAREHSRVMAERAREEGSLPRDLWKKPMSGQIFRLWGKDEGHVGEDRHYGQMCGTIEWMTNLSMEDVTDVDLGRGESGRRGTLPTDLWKKTVDG